MVKNPVSEIPYVHALVLSKLFPIAEGVSFVLRLLGESYFKKFPYPCRLDNITCFAFSIVFCSICAVLYCANCELMEF